MERYRLGSLTANEDYQVVFKAHEDGEWWYLATYPDERSAIESANSLRRFLIDLNIASEGLHIVEHILLRPEGKSKHDDLRLPEDIDFFSFRVSVIFPSWTARCHDDQFRLLAEETVQMNCPAHIYPEFYWLDFSEMCEFEGLYEKWLDVKSENRATSEARNVAARALLAFLLQHQSRD